MKVLVAAYACEPGKGSEPGVGWHLVREIARRHETWVITRLNNGPTIEAELERRPISNLRVAYHDLPLLQRFKHLPGGVWAYHYVWHLSLGSLAEQLHREVGFDVAHQLTFGSFRFPGVLHRLGVPVIVGPVGGAEEPPISFWADLGWRGALKEALRWTSNRLARVDPFLRRTLRNARLVLVVSPETRRAVRQITGPSGTIGFLPQIGIDPELIGPVRTRGHRDSGAACRALHVGRLEGWKGAHLVIRAVAEARRRGADVRLTILGTGPMRERLAMLAARLEVLDGIHLVGRLPSLEDVVELYHRHDVFVFPSLREAGGMALIEAMAAGLPAVVLDLGGPAVSLTREAGFSIRPTTPSQVVDGMAAALVRLTEESETRERMGTAAADRVRRLYAWDAKAAILERYYGAAVLGAPLPEFEV